MWKSGWKIDKDWIHGKEKWLLLLVCGLLLLILSVPSGTGGSREKEAGSPQVKGEAAGGMDGSRQEMGEPLPDGSEAAGKAVAPSADAERQYEAEMEQRVKELLKNVEGVGEVDVMIRLKSSKEKVLHVDKDKSRTSTEEKDSAGGARKAMTEDIKETSLKTGSTGNETPVVEKELQPEIEGIIISAQGGGSASVKTEISEAMEALFGLPAHKIKVLKRVE